MLIQGHIFLVFVLLLIGALTLWIFITQTNARWFTKAIITTGLLLALGSAWVGLRAIYGFPYNAHPNNESYYLVGSYIVEPNPKTAFKGNIFIWLIPKKEAGEKMDWIDRIGLAMNTDQPRAWVIPYTREMHKQLSGLNKSRQGGAIAVTIGKKKKKGKSHSGDNVEDRQKFVPYILPENFVPQKEYTPDTTSSTFSGTPDGWLGEGERPVDYEAIAEQNSNTSNGPDSVDIGIGHPSADGTPSTNNNTQEQQLPTDRGGINNVIP